MREALYETAPGLISNSNLIEDFSQAEGDWIDLGLLISSIHFIGTAAFTGVEGEVRYAYDAVKDQTIVDIDIDGDGSGDPGGPLGIVLSGDIALIAGDFIL